MANKDIKKRKLPKKNLKAIVADLRAHDELDEEKLRKLQKRRSNFRKELWKFMIAPSIMFAIVILGPGLDKKMTFLMASCFLGWGLVVKIWTSYIDKYAFYLTYGKIITGEIIRSDLKYQKSRYPRRYLEILKHDGEIYRHTGLITEEIQKKKSDTEEILKVGKKVFLFLSPENGKEFPLVAVENNYKNQDHYLRKEK